MGEAVTLLSTNDSLDLLLLANCLDLSFILGVKGLKSLLGVKDIFLFLGVISRLKVGDLDFYANITIYPFKNISCIIVYMWLECKSFRLFG